MKTPLFLVFVVAASAFAEEHTPCFLPDVAAFIERRDGCDHFRGEEPYDEERRAFLEKNIVELCSGTDQQLAALKIKYSSDPNVIAKLVQYEADIELRENE